MRQLPWGKFKRIITKLNSKVRFWSGYGRGLGSMVYLFYPRHPDSDPKTGLWEVLAVPSPRYFRNMPQFDVAYPSEGKYHWVRGYSTFFKIACGMKDPDGRKIFSVSDVRSFDIGAFSYFNSKKFKKEVQDSNKTEEQLTHERMQAAGLFRAYA